MPHRTHCTRVHWGRRRGMAHTCAKPSTVASGICSTSSVTKSVAYGDTGQTECNANCFWATQQPPTPRDTHTSTRRE